MRKAADIQEQVEREAEALERELDATVDNPDAPPTQMTGAQTLQLLAQQHGALVSEYQRWRLLGRMSTIVGDHVSAKSQFDQAKTVLNRLVALREIAREEGLEPEFVAILDAWKAKQTRPIGDAAEPPAVLTQAAERAALRTARKKRGRR